MGGDSTDEKAEHEIYTPKARMFTGSMLPDWLMRRKEISPGAKICFARLCKYANHKTAKCCPKQKTLAAELGVSVRAVRLYLDELKRHRLIITKRMGFTQANRYFFLAHEWMDAPQSDRKDSSGHECTDSSGQNLEGTGSLELSKRKVAPPKSEKSKMTTSERLRAKRKGLKHE